MEAIVLIAQPCGQGPLWSRSNGTAPKEEGGQSRPSYNALALANQKKPSAFGE
jgi:hypothetical protein